MNITPETLRTALTCLRNSTPSTTYGEGVHKYALSLLDAWADRIRYNVLNNLDTEPLTPCLAYQLPAILLCGYIDWRAYAAACGQGVLAVSYSVAVRLYGKEKADALGDEYYMTDRPILDEARALRQACDMLTHLARVITMLNA